MTGIIIPCYNRPEYLQRCLNSVLNSNLKDTIFLLIDDASIDSETKELIKEFNPPGVPVIRITNPNNRGIKANLLTGFDLLFKTCDLVINLDSDAIVKPEWIDILKHLKSEHPNHIVSGFNSKNTNKDGSLRNPIIEEHDTYILKKHCNGINMCMNQTDYEKHVRPALAREGNWDYNSTNPNGFIIAKPSVIQHIGVNSSMGHTENPDMACDFKLLSLPTVTLFGIDAHDPAGIRFSADICQQSVDFGDVKIITERLFQGREGYSEFCIKHLANYIETEHVLIIHPDGYILNPSAWDDEFLQYDYIGATWWYKDNMNVGNGGFSLRSKKLLDILAKIDIHQTHPEDDVICRQYRYYLEEEHGIRFAPEEVANRFSIEAYGVQDKRYNGAFGFHGKHVDFRGANLPHVPRFGVQPANGTIKKKNRLKNTAIRW